MLYKTTPTQAGPRDLRILLILSTIYRRWASYRLQSLAPWIHEWELEEMFAGIPGKGAEQASYTTAILLEYLKCQQHDFTGGRQT